MRHLLVVLGFLALSLSSFPGTGEAQRPYSPQVVPAEEYARAEGFLGNAMNSLVLGTGVRANWLADGRLLVPEHLRRGSRVRHGGPGSRDPGESVRSQQTGPGSFGRYG